MTVEAIEGPNSALSVAAQTTNKIRLFGLGSGGDTKRVKPMRISTMQEMLLLEAMMRGSTGMERDQFAQNPWGFPFIPFPATGGAFNGNHRVLIPEGVEKHIGQHPIFWIDEALTTPTEDEQSDPARWCVRMFYLIMGFGLWNDKLQWISAPCMKLQVQSISGTEYENYVKGFESSLTAVRYTEEDLFLPLEEINREANKAIHECVKMQKAAWTAYRTEQLAAYDYSLRLLDDEGFTPWMDLSNDLAEVSTSISQAHSNHESLSPFVDPLFDVTGRIVKFFDTLEMNNVILSAVALRSHAATVNEYNRIYSGIAQYQEKIIESGYEQQLHEAADKMINHADEDSDAEHFARMYRIAENIYLNTERRLRLQTVNYARILNDQAPFATYTEMEIIQATSDNIGLDNLPSLQDVSERY